MSPVRWAPLGELAVERGLSVLQSTAISAKRPDQGRQGQWVTKIHVLTGQVKLVRGRVWAHGRMEGRAGLVGGRTLSSTPPVGPTALVPGQVGPTDH